jgi:nicotinamidase-related amidase
MLKQTGMTISSWCGLTGGVRPEDTLLVVGMQNDFLPGTFAPWGGRAAVLEGESTVDIVTQLIEAFSSKGGLIVATRAFHPQDHTSFYDQGGSMPPHCVQTTPGCAFYPKVAEALQHAYSSPLAQEPDENGLPPSPGRVEIAFQGFLEEVASLGAFRYDRQFFEERLRNCRWDLHEGRLAGVACAETWTGAMALKCSNLPNDINANPDISALLQPDLRPLHEIIPRHGRLLIAGLALDTAVLDSAVAASRLGYKEVSVAIDACRATHFGPSGEYGSGFLTDPAYIVCQFQKHSVNIVQSSEVLRACSNPCSPRPARAGSPGRGGG